MDASAPRTSIPVPAACMTATAAFTVALLAGVAVENPAGAILARSLGVLVVAWPVGFVAGIVLERLFREQAASEAARTIDEDASVGALEDDVEIVDEFEPESDGSIDQSQAA